jgi:hypothetical protein
MRFNPGRCSGPSCGCPLCLCGHVKALCQWIYGVTGDPLPNYSTNTFGTGVWTTGAPTVDQWDGVSLRFIWIGPFDANDPQRSGYLLPQQTVSPYNCLPGDTSAGYGTNQPTIECRALCSGQRQGLNIKLWDNNETGPFYLFRGDGVVNPPDSACMLPATIPCDSGVVATYTNIRIWKLVKGFPNIWTLLTDSGQFLWTYE